MSKFNANKESAVKSKTYEGADAYVKDPMADWINFLFSSYLEDRFYESADEQMNRYIELTNTVGEEYGWELVAKMAMFSRNELGLRSISQLTAAMVNDKNIVQKRAFFRNFPHRLDDVSEIFGAVDLLKSKRSHALVRGAGDYLSSLDDYAFGKYKMSRKEYNLYDLINITHAHSKSVDKYKKGVLETPDTWETAISAANDEEEKSAEWKRLVEEERLGYLALLRNLRNIVNSDVDQKWIDGQVCPQLTHRAAIRKSLVFPYQIYCAYKNIGIRNQSIDRALDQAFAYACENMPELSGKNLVMLDVSGSMDDRISSKSQLTIKEVGAVYGAAIALSSGADFIKFGTIAKKMKINKLDSVFNVIEKMCDGEDCGYGTNVPKAFELAEDNYDRIFLISDMQTMTRNYWYCSEESGKDAYERYCRTHNCHPHLYSFDLGNYSTQVGNPNDNHVHLLTSLNDKLFSFINLLEDGTNLAKYIDENYTYC